MRWSTLLARRRGRAASGGTGAAGDQRADARFAGLPVEDIDGVLLLRSGSDGASNGSLDGGGGFPDPATVAEVARAVDGEVDVTTVIVANDGGQAPAAAFWSHLGALCDALRRAEVTRVRLVLSGAGDHRRRQPCVARRIADGWGLDVIAPDGEVLVAPGGTLFVGGDAPTSTGWWHFSPDQAPRPLGRRAPAPDWQEAFAGVPRRTSNCVVQPIPAGVVMRPARSAAPADGDPCYAVPVDRSRATVLVDTERAEDVTADEVATVLRSVPTAHRAAAQLAPGGGRADLLPLGQSVADLLGDEVVVLTGIPLLPERAASEAAADAARPMLLGTDGRPRWVPFVPGVACAPRAAGGSAENGVPHPAPRPLGWNPPFQGLGADEPGLLRLTDHWQAAVTRAGLAVGQRDAPRPSVSGRPVTPDTLTIELGAEGQRLDDSVLPALSTLLEKLGPEVRSRATVLVDDAWPGGQRELHRVAARFGLADVRHGAADSAGRPASSDVPTPSEDPTRSATPAPSDAPAPPDTPAPSDAVAPSDALAPSGTPLRPAPAAPPETGAETGAEPTRAPAPRSVVSSAPPPAGLGEAGTSRPVTTATASTAPATAAEPAAHAPEVTTAEATTAAMAPADRPARRAPVEPPEPSEPGGGTAAAPTEPPTAVPRSEAAPVSAAEPAPVGHPSTDPPASGPRSAAPEPVDGGPEPSGGPESVGEPAPVDEPAVAPAESGSWPTADRTAPFLAGQVSVEQDQTAFRLLAASAWEHHSAAVARALTRMPALRGMDLEAAHPDLVAVHAYLTGEGGPLDHQDLRRGLAAGDEDRMAYAACLASGLRRLPSYRGAALRGPGLPTRGDAVPPVGSVLRVAGPVSTLAGTTGPVGDGPASCVVWSVTGRRVRQFVDGADPHDEVVFPPGTAFRVLGGRELAGSPVVLLRELSGPEPDPRGGADHDGDGLGERDRATLARLEAALDRTSAPGRRGDWPDRCRGPLD